MRFSLFAVQPVPSEAMDPLLEPPGPTTKRSRLHRWGLGPLPSEHLRHPETWRHTIFLVVGISGSTVSWWAGTIFQSAILVLIMANVGLVIVDTEPYFNTSAGTPFNKFYIQFEIVSVIIFTIEYLLRVWCCVEAPGHISRLRWAMTPLAIVDVVSLVPFYTDLLTPHDNHFRGATMIRTLRTFSLLRMERTFKGFRRIADVLQHKGEELFITAFIAMIMLILSSSIMYYVENPGTSADDRISEPPPILCHADPCYARFRFDPSSSSRTRAPSLRRRARPDPPRDKVHVHFNRHVVVGGRVYHDGLWRYGSDHRRGQIPGWAAGDPGRRLLRASSRHPGLRFRRDHAAGEEGAAGAAERRRRRGGRHVAYGCAQRWTDAVAAGASEHRDGSAVRGR